MLIPLILISLPLVAWGIKKLSRPGINKKMRQSYLQYHISYYFVGICCTILYVSCLYYDSIYDKYKEDETYKRNESVHMMVQIFKAVILAFNTVLNLTIFYYCNKMGFGILANN